MTKAVNAYDSYKWAPRSVRCIHAGAPLSGNEPDLSPAELRDLLRAGYGAIVMLEPGDATRYSLVLLPTVGGFTFGLTGNRRLAQYPMEWTKPIDQVFDENPHTAGIIGWWLEKLRTDGRVEQDDE